MEIKVFIKLSAGDFWLCCTKKSLIFVSFYKKKVDCWWKSSQRQSYNPITVTYQTNSLCVIRNIQVHLSRSLASLFSIHKLQNRRKILPTLMAHVSVYLLCSSYFTNFCLSYQRLYFFVLRLVVIATCKFFIFFSFVHYDISTYLSRM